MKVLLRTITITIFLSLLIPFNIVSQSITIENKTFTFPEVTSVNGQIILLGGQILNRSGLPIQGAMIEIWQTDDSGVYDHPSDPGTNSRDRSFQFFGSSTTDSQGRYVFRTLLPGIYEPRPRHIHFRVKQNGQILLTSQFYFDIPNGESSSPNRSLQIPLSLDEHRGVQFYSGLFNLVVGLSEGNLLLTPSQATGPYYPVIIPSSKDNDLLVLD
jgi:hypothetical protein